MCFTSHMWGFFLLWDHHDKIDLKLSQYYLNIFQTLTRLDGKLGVSCREKVFETWVSYICGFKGCHGVSLVVWVNDGYDLYRHSCCILVNRHGKERTSDRRRLKLRSSGLNASAAPHDGNIFTASMGSAPSPCSSTLLYQHKPPVSLCKCVFGCPPGTPSLSSSLWPSLNVFSMCILPMFCSQSDWNNKVSNLLQTLTRFQAVMMHFYSYISDLMQSKVHCSLLFYPWL